VAPDRRSAKARFRTMLMGGSHETKQPRIEGLPDQFLEGGIYENSFVREDGVWKIQKHDYNMLWQCNLPEGWAHSAVHMVPLTKIFPEDPNGPDRLIDMPRVWPDTRHVPFHYPTPDGYPDTAADWSSAGGTLDRWNTHMSLAAHWWPNEIRRPKLESYLPTHLPATYGDLVQAVAKELLFVKLPGEQRDAICAFFDRGAGAPLHDDDAIVTWRLSHLVSLVLDAPAHLLR